MTLTKEELEKLMGDYILLISRAKKQGDKTMEIKYKEQLKFLEMAYNDINKAGRRLPSYDG
ncbi:MAG TPA: hypothetical protein VH500_07260 [Nitrososphaeraceae archaeon]|jgi:hypothetical protein